MSTVQKAPPLSMSLMPHSSSMSPWKTLLWKEWHEHKWNTLWITLFCLTGVAGADSAHTGLAMALFISLAGALFLATGVLAGEREDGAWTFIHSLPVPRWKLGLIRMGVSSLMCVLPLIISGLVILFIRPLFASTQQSGVPLMLFLSCGLCLSHYLWITATAYGQPTQIRVGLLGIIVVTCWFAMELALSTLRTNHGTTWIEKLSWLGPTGWGIHTTVPPTEPGMPFLLCQCTVMGLLFLVSVFGYGTPPRQVAKTFNPNVPTPLSPPHRSPSAAITWLQIRESLPLCGAGAAIMFTLGLAAIMLFTPTSSVTQMSGMIETIAFLIGIPWMAVIAVGTFVPNLTGGLYTFWRSRPVDVSEWYWSKFWLGAIVSILSIHLPVMILIGITQKLAWKGPLASCVGYLVYPLIHLAVYSFAALAASYIRQIMLAGSFAITLAILGIGIPSMPDSPLAFLKHDRVRESLTQFVTSDLNMAHAKGFLPLLIILLVMTYLTSSLGSMLVRRNISFRKATSIRGKSNEMV